MINRPMLDKKVKLSIANIHDFVFEYFHPVGNQIYLKPTRRRKYDVSQMKDGYLLRRSD